MLRETIERSLKLARRRAEPYKDATEKTHTFHGGWSKGYHEGRIAALESVLDELDNEPSLIQIAAAKATRCDELFEELERITEQFGEFLDALDKSPAEYSAYVSSKQLLEKIRNESTG